MGSPGGSDSKKSACNAGRPRYDSWVRKIPGKGKAYPLQYSYLENSMDRGGWQVIVHGVAKNRTGLSDQHSYFFSSSAEKEEVLSRAYS